MGRCSDANKKDIYMVMCEIKEVWSDYCDGLSKRAVPPIILKRYLK